MNVIYTINIISSKHFPENASYCRQAAGGYQNIALLLAVYSNNMLQFLLRRAYFQLELNHDPSL